MQTTELKERSKTLLVLEVVIDRCISLLLCFNYILQSDMKAMYYLWITITRIHHATLKKLTNINENTIYYDIHNIATYRIYCNDVEKEMAISSNGDYATPDQYLKKRRIDAIKL